MPFPEITDDSATRTQTTLVYLPEIRGLVTPVDAAVCGAHLHVNHGPLV